MASAPWYLNNEGPSLKHQRKWKSVEEASKVKTWYDRGAKVYQATKYRKGACENCGSIAHKTKDCLDRPRVKGAKWTNKNIAADEKVEDIKFSSFDAKRDRWNGYTPDEWIKQAEKFEKVAEIRQEIRKKELLEEKFKQAGKQPAGTKDGEEDGEEEDPALIAQKIAAFVATTNEEEEDKFEEEEDAAFNKVEKRVRTVGGGATGSVRNLRIREDTAKYLLNLDVNSAHYDPKSRSMREDPNPEKDPSEKTFAGDNFVRSAGQISDFHHLNQFSVTAYEKGQDIHLQANPSQAELSHKQFLQKKAALTSRTKTDILDKYGNAAEKPDEQVLALRATEAYVEYDAAGRVIKGQEVKAHSKYEEDVYIHNHTSVWGSWYNDGTWGYACCHQCVKNSYCIGEVGLRGDVGGGTSISKNNNGSRMIMSEAEQLEKVLAAKAAEIAQQRQAEEEEEEEGEENGAGAGKKKKRLESYVPGSTAALWGTDADQQGGLLLGRDGGGGGGVQLDEEKLRKALEKQDKAMKEEEEEEEGGGNDRRKKKRGYNSLKGDDDDDVTAEDMEAYRLKRDRADDPLTAFAAAKSKTNDKEYDLV
jgi:pre-mRNA-processing factor SLU7